MAGISRRISDVAAKIEKVTMEGGDVAVLKFATFYYYNVPILVVFIR